MAKKDELNVWEWAALIALGWAVLNFLKGEHSHPATAATMLAQDSAAMPTTSAPPLDLRRLPGGDAQGTDAEYWRDPSTYDVDAKVY